MAFEILWTEDSETHIARRGITPGEVEDAIYSQPRWVAPGRSNTTLVFARTSAGRYLLVCSPKPSTDATTLSPPGT